MKNKFLKILFVFGILFYSINSFAAWSNIGNSVSFMETSSNGNDTAIVYSGCGVSDGGAQNWANALYESKLKTKGIKYLYAVALPSGANNCAVSVANISNSKIVTDLESKNTSGQIKNIIVIMHSSGAFTAQDFLRQINNKSAFNKIVTAFNIDGANISGVALKKTYLVIGKSGTIKSLNHDIGIINDETIDLILPTGCSTAFCTHMRLVNSTGGNSTVDADYKNTTASNVTSSYLDKLPNVSVSSSGGTTLVVGGGVANTSTTLTAKTFNEQTGIDASAGSYELISPIGNLSKIPDVSDNGFSDFVNLLIRIAIALAGAIAVVMLIIGGIQYMGTDSVWEKGESRSRMTSAIIGLVLLLTSYFILFNINPDLVNIRIGGLTVNEEAWDIEFGDGGSQYLTNGSLTPGSTTKNCPEGFVNTGVFVACKSIAKNIENMVAAAKKDGIILGGGGFRTKEQQIELRKKNCGGDVDTKKSTQCNPPTAKPGTSRHESGKAFDITCDGKSMAGSKCFTWLQNNAAKYGLKNYKAEPWHWSTDGH